MKNTAIKWVAGTGFMLLACSPLQADVTVEQRLEVKGGGSWSMLSSSGTVKTEISGDKSRSENHTKSESKMLGSMMPDQDSISINRLDQNVVRNLFPEKQQYDEISYEELQAQMEQASAQLQQLQQGGQGGALPVDENECQWSDSKFDVQKTGQKQRFANVKAEQHIITIQETCTVPANGQTCVMTWTMENWMAKRMPGAKELTAFGEALAERMGVDSWAGGMSGASQGFLGMFRDGWEEAIEETQELKGYPVKTVMTMEMGGEQCTAASGQPIAMDDVWGNALDAGLESGANTAGYHAGNKVSQEAAKAAGGGVGGSIAGSAVGSASGEVISGMLKHFGKKSKKTQPPPEPEAAANPAAASTVLFQMSSELTAVSDKGISPDRFEVPGHWKKR